MNSDREIDISRLSWLVDRRCSIQQALLDVLKLMRDKNLTASDDDSVKRIASLLVGTGFSLWRAVFLSHPQRKWEMNLQDATAYLQKVIQTNTIAFGDDLRMDGWAFAYYLQNAHLRLRAICADMPELADELGTDMI